MLVTPYGDPEAHGSIGRTLTFIRRRGIVYARPYKIPFDPRSTAQLAQRQAFADAIANWHALSTESKAYYNARAAGQSYTGYNLYLGADMDANLPSTTPLNFVNLNNIVIGVVRSSQPDGWSFVLWDVGWVARFGTVDDNSNIYTDHGSQPASPDVLIDIYMNTDIINVLLRDTITITFDALPSLTVFLPALSADDTLWIADDGSTYWDQAMTQLACGATV